MDSKETTLLSSLVTATAGIATTLKAVRDEQKVQSQKLDNTVKGLSELSERVSVVEATVETAQTATTAGLEVTQKNVSDEVVNVNKTLTEKLTSLVEILTNDDSLIELHKLIESSHKETMDETRASNKAVIAKLDNMNQLEALHTLITALQTMQVDLSTLTTTLITTSEGIKELEDTNALMSARLDSVDLRLATMVAGEIRDDDVDRLENAIALLGE